MWLQGALVPQINYIAPKTKQKFRHQTSCIFNRKLTLSQYRPGQDPRAPVISDSHNFQIFGIRIWLMFSGLRTGHLYTSAHIPGTHFRYRPSRPKGHSPAERIISIKIPIEPATFRLVAQCLNQLRQRVLLDLINRLKERERKKQSNVSSVYFGYS